MIISVRYNRAFAIALFSTAIILLTIRVILFFITGKVNIADTAVGIFLMYAGWKYLRGIFFELHHDKIVVNLIGGPFKRTIYIGSVSNLIFSGTDLYLTHDGKRKKVPIGPFMSHAEDWRKFRVYVEQQKPGGELHDFILR